MIERKDIEHLANLSRIELDEKALEGLTKDIESIILYVDQIKEVSATLDDKKTVGILRNILREDENPHESGIHTEKILEEVPKKEEGFIKVKNIL